MTNVYRLQVNSSIYELARVRSWFQQFKSLPKPFRQQLDLALTEGFSNVIYHAHEHLPEETPIEIEVQIFPDRWSYASGTTVSPSIFLVRNEPSIRDIKKFLT